MFVVSGMGLYGSLRLLSGKSVKINIPQVGISMVVICFLQAVYGLLQYFDLVSSPFVHAITGSFDNPAGVAACLCAGLPFAAFLLLKGNKKYVKRLGWVAAAIITITVVLSQSRAGIISIAIIGVAFLFQKLNQKRVWRYLALVSLMLLLFGCYWMKKDSADGRLLIWQCSINMMKDAPWTGHGIGSFEAHYMDYQADYFKQQEQNSFAMLADNVKQPFNEYLGVLLNFGMLGLVVLLMLIAAIIYCHRKYPRTDKQIALYSLISIGTFSLFSYPFTYPFIWIVTFLNIFIITRDYIQQAFVRKRIKNIVGVTLLVGSLIGVYKLTGRIQAELEWGKASTLTLYRPYGEILPTYEKLEKKFADNPYFLYNYAAILQEMKQYKESLQVALKCRRYWADYDLELIIGENYQRLNQQDLAEKYYTTASLMCPSRFLPLYKLFHLYKENGKKEQALAMAQAVIDKPMKIKTTAIRRMKREMEKEKLELNELTQ